MQALSAATPNPIAALQNITVDAGVQTSAIVVFNCWNITNVLMFL